MGALCGSATPAQLDAITRYGEAVGLMFQVVDDLLDVTQTTEQLGKTAGKDEKQNKLTYPAVLGIEGTRAEAQRLAPQDPAPRVGLVRVNLAAGEVAADYASAPKDPKVQSWLAQLDRVLKADPNYGPAVVERGRLLLILGRAPEAKSALTLGVTLTRQVKAPAEGEAKPEGEAEAGKPQRIALVGDSDFLSNGYVGQLGKNRCSIVCHPRFVIRISKHYARSR